jgi:hypothetical protein
VNGFTGTLTFTCAATGTAPAGVTCTPPSSFNLTAATTAAIVFTTTSRVNSAGMASLTGGRSPWNSAGLLAAAGLLMLLAGRARHLGRFTRIGGLLALMVALLLPAIGCNDSKSSANPGGTPAGSYTYTVTATSGNLSHTEAVNLTVQ